MSGPRRIGFASPEEEAAAQDIDLAKRFRAIGAAAADRIPIPFHIGGYNLDRASMIELGEELWGADEMREALATTPGQKLNLCLRRDGDILLVRHPTDPDIFLAACLAPTHVNLDHDWTRDPHAPAVLHVPADPHRAVEAIAATLLPRQQAAVTALRQSAVAGGTEVVVGVGRTWRHAANSPPTSPTRPTGEPSTTSNTTGSRAPTTASTPAPTGTSSRPNTSSNTSSTPVSAYAEDPTFPRRPARAKAARPRRPP
ncbi:hypothetical protein [Embleya sp. NPDC020630]|uniref:hypothetical protein n=1 Tax=Embleya sp. NPDC020630 TaxID=3363979 RepID=UPI0037963087